jgi:predicted phosphodiesterase
MSSIAIITDVHSNLHALEAVLEDARDRGIERFACLGDTVGYNAFPRECLERVQALGGPYVLGNHDEFVGGGAQMLEMIEAHEEAMKNPVWAGVRHSILELGVEKSLEFREIPFEVEYEGATLAHASLHGHGEWPYLMQARDAMPTLGLLKTPVGFFGHTHQPAVFTHQKYPQSVRVNANLIQLHPQGRTAVVVGSVGQPRNGDPSAQWAIFDPEALTVQMVQTKYDAQAAGRAVLDAGLPQHSALRLLRGG